ncbi:exopolysaccharide biosynthesis polyprenyl glycosylphosphotransferase [Bifidobacterium psychraerophilum DSM 22366]|uniref:Undecaprenyl-phosphate sugar phosphotransferase CspD n=3 Tax=Bifidobacterium psychraerophilum TaxID=218140 RepID=A0A087CJ47_9BIFI|nr:undecaprenyl-phosphate sugar phosphotransferase CspD [Bifidobacterium psychraerophilum]PKA94351.1 exopolysaccharide biosynthesis polyprenyl glycosylphosphotransferase [Bifidobacterium psychraerophilum DSM 22366]
MRARGSGTLTHEEELFDHGGEEPFVLEETSAIHVPQAGADDHPDDPAKPQRTMMFSNSVFSDSFKPSETRRYFNKTPVWRYWFVLALVATDLVSMLLSLVICLSIRPHSYMKLEDSMPVGVFLALQCGIWLLCLLFCGTYQRHVVADGYALYTKIFNATIIAVVLTSCLVYMLQLNLPRTAIIAAPTLAGVLEGISRWLMRRSLHQKRAKGRCRYSTVLLGSSDGINETLHSLVASSALGYEAVAVCPITVETERGREEIVASRYIADPSVAGSDDLKVIPFTNHLPRTVMHMGVQTVLVTDTLERDSVTLHALSLAIESLGIELAVSVSVADLSGHKLYLRDSAQQQVLTASLPQYSLAIRLVKRLIDIVGSFFALVISVPLVMLPVALAIKHEDGGPVLYKQERIGQNGVPFDCYKFRSMVLNADQLDAKLAAQSGQEYGALFKLKEDPRVTKVGRIIRKFSLDEFPQFFNVLKGDMSLVGPRPQRKYEVEKYDMLYSTRLLVKPGITGPWQISGRSNLSKEEAERLDVTYIENWSLTSDLVILLKTVLVVFRAVGSY